MTKLQNVLEEAGACAFGVVKAGEADASARSAYERWIGEGRNAGMDYLEKYPDVRFDTRQLLKGAQSMICCAFPFAPAELRKPSLPYIASYALGDDYHNTIRRRLKKAVRSLQDTLGGEWRICIDTAPVLERYWAVKAGFGTVGKNGALIVPGYGSMVFLAEIITTIKLPPASFNASGQDPTEWDCNNCGRCIEACPGKALKGDGTLDARRCISYLSIEHRGEWDEEGRAVMATPQGRRTLYGCDLCLRVCLLNHAIPPSNIPEFTLRKSLRHLSEEDIRTMPPDDFSLLFQGSAIRRAGLEGLQRNLRKD